jgi:hypothetical protein
MNPAALLAPAVLASAFAFAAPAPAATVGVADRDGGRTLVYAADPGEFNELTIMLQGGRFTVQDGTVGFRETLPVRAEHPCSPNDSPERMDMFDAFCPPQGVALLDLAVGDENDYVSIGSMSATDYPTVIDLGTGSDRVYAGPQRDVVRGGTGDDTLTGNAGRDTLLGGAGDDAVAAADGGVPDEIACGDGYDTVKADLVDVTAEDCELVGIGPDQPQQIVMRVEPAPSGLLSRLSCPAACEVESELVLGARRVVGTGRARRDAAGRLVLRTRLRRGMARRIARLARPRLTLRTTVSVDGAPTTIVRRRVRLPRS